jgi:hypothetical protein
MRSKPDASRLDPLMLMGGVVVDKIQRDHVADAGVQLRVGEER